MGCVLLGVFVFFLSSGLGTTTLESPIYGPAFYPRILSGLLAFLGILLVFFASQKGDPFEQAGIDNRSLYVGVLSLVSYVFLMPLAGFVVTSTAYLAFSFHFYTGKTRSRLMRHVFLGLGISVSVFIIFEYLLRVTLPHGWLL